MDVAYKDVAVEVIAFLQFIGCSSAAHELEMFSKVYFDLEYFDSLIESGSWISLSKYLRAFVNNQDGHLSQSVLFSVAKHRIVEAMLSGRKKLARSILSKDVETLDVSSNEMMDLKNFIEGKESSLLKEWEEETAQREILSTTLRENLQKLLGGITSFPKSASSSSSVSSSVSLCKSDSKDSPMQNPKKDSKEVKGREKEKDLFFSSSSSSSDEISDGSFEDDSELEFLQYKREESEKEEEGESEDEHPSNNRKRGRKKRLMTTRNYYVFPHVVSLIPDQASAKTISKLWEDKNVKEAWKSQEEENYRKFKSWIQVHNLLDNRHSSNKTLWFFSPPEGYEQENIRRRKEFEESEESFKEPKKQKTEREVSNEKAEKKRRGRRKDPKHNLKREKMIPIMRELAPDRSNAKSMTVLWNNPKIQEAWNELDPVVDPNSKERFRRFVGPFSNAIHLDKNFCVYYFD